MLGQPVGCGTMQKCAGARRWSMLRIKLRILRPHIPFLLTLAWKGMAASLLHLSTSGSPAPPIHIINSHIRKQGKSHTYLQSDSHWFEHRIEIMKWVAEKRRPFIIVKDSQFILLMKTGRPGYWLPLVATVARDVKHIFVEMHQRISTMLKVILTYLFVYPAYHPHRMLTVHWTLQWILGCPQIAVHLLP